MVVNDKVNYEKNEMVCVISDSNDDSTIQSKDILMEESDSSSCSSKRGEVNTSLVSLKVEISS